ncbi:hypothetical protein F4808DRAFT_368261 [Astrocystis sublimbata]|nr:hypothetical protein F4808DRAFT_368261 [Astrocystis sublimbata]
MPLPVFVEITRSSPQLDIPAISNIHHSLINPAFETASSIEIPSNLKTQWRSSRLASSMNWLIGSRMLLPSPASSHFSIADRRGRLHPRFKASQLLCPTHHDHQRQVLYAHRHCRLTLPFSPHHQVLAITCSNRAAAATVARSISFLTPTHHPAPVLAVPVPWARDRMYRLRPRVLVDLSLRPRLWTSTIQSHEESPAPGSFLVRPQKIPQDWTG